MMALCIRGEYRMRLEAAPAGRPDGHAVRAAAGRNSKNPEGLHEIEGSRSMSAWMPHIDPSWQGVTAFYELIFGTWIAYALLVWIWEGWLKTPLREWRYAMIIFLSAGAFWVNHYFSGKPEESNWVVLINLYTVFFLYSYWRLAIKHQARSTGWKLGALLTGVVLTVGFIGAEQLARYGVANWNMHEFCWMTLAFLGFVWLIRWRGKAPVRPEIGPQDAYKTYRWRGLGSPHE
jgi:hypothetical protein